MQAILCWNTSRSASAAHARMPVGSSTSRCQCKHAPPFSSQEANNGKRPSGETKGRPILVRKGSRTEQLNRHQHFQGLTFSPAAATPVANDLLPQACHAWPRDSLRSGQAMRADFLVFRPAEGDSHLMTSSRGRWHHCFSVRTSAL